MHNYNHYVPRYIAMNEIYWFARTNNKSIDFDYYPTIIY